MRPYFAIIRDSFHAAFASRILWIVLIAIVVFLLALSPVGYQEIFTVDFSRGDVNSNSRLTGLLAKALDSEQASAAKRVAEALPANLQSQIEKASGGDDDSNKRVNSSEYADAFNELLETDDWYDPQLWKDTVRLRELRELDELDAAEMEKRLKLRRARLRIEAALPNAFRSRPDRSIQLTYGTLETPLKLPLRKDQFADILNQVVYPTILNILLGVGAVFVGILVTSPIIPDMFQPGSLHLLLSKPIARPALYLSKFVGGCAFVLLCVTLLVSGLWLISGTRLDIWNHRLYYSIPVFVFLFAVYYSVSALAGLHWRSAVVSVAVTVVFWFLCFIVGTASNLFESLVADPARAQSLIVSDQQVVISTQSGALNLVTIDSGKKKALIEIPFGQPPGSVAPVQLAAGKLAVARSESGGFGQFGGTSRLALFDPAEAWKELPGIELPTGTRRLIPTPAGGLLTVSLNGVYYAPADKLQPISEAEVEESQSKGLFGSLQKLIGNATSGFQSALPDSFSIISPSAVELVPETGDLIVYSGGSLHRFTRASGAAKWSETARVEIEGDNTLPIKLSASPNEILLARKDDPLRVFDAADLSLKAELPIDETYAVLRMEMSPAHDYGLAMLSNKRIVKIALGDSPGIVPADLPYQGDIEAFVWDDSDRLWLAHNIDRLTVIEESMASDSQTVVPERDFWRNLYAWLITPLRTITPQTGEVGEIVIAAICGRSNVELTVGERVERQQLSIVRPLATCGGFATVMLLLGCYYVYRQDF